MKQFDLVKTLATYVVCLALLFALLLVLTQVFGRTKLDMDSAIGRFNGVGLEILAEASGKLAWEVLAAFVIANFVGIGLAVSVVELMPKMERHILSLGVALKATPLIVVLPVIYNLGFFSYRRLATVPGILGGILIAFFPTLIEAMHGYRSVPHDTLKYFATVIGVTRRDRLQIRVRFALRYLFPAFKVSAVLSVVGCVVGELLLPTVSSVGELITRGANYTDFDLYFIALAICGLIGIVGFALVESLERKLCWWEMKNETS